MRFGHLELPTSDPAASMAYYVDTLGFELVANQGDTFIWVKKGGLEILLRPRGDYPMPNVVFYSDDPASEVEGARRQGECWHFEDPDGNGFQVVDPGADHS